MSNKREYEMVLVLDSANRDNLTGIQENLKKSLEKREVEVTHHEEWGVRKLFHPLKHIESGMFQFFKIKSEPAAIAQLNADLRVNSGVLKSFITRLG